MRKLKFRVWDGKNMIMNPLGFMDQYKWDDLMQYTGVNDKEGTELYEGDIVMVDYGEGTIRFHHGCYWIEWIDDPEANMELLAIANFKRGTPRTDLLLTGNIYETPHLLNRRGSEV